jgi:hypothetical protein
MPAHQLAIEIVDLGLPIIEIQSFLHLLHLLLFADALCGRHPSLTIELPSLCPLHAYMPLALALSGSSRPSCCAKEPLETTPSPHISSMAQLACVLTQR